MNKKIKKTIVFTVLPLLLAAIFILYSAASPTIASETGAGTTDTAGSETAQTTTPAASGDMDMYGLYATPEERIASMEKSAETSSLILYVDKEHAEVAVVDKKSGEAWFTTPYDYRTDRKSSDETKANLASFLRLTYYDMSQNERYMSSYTDCITKKQFAISNIENGIKISMQIGRLEESLLLPNAAAKDNFEEKVINVLTESSDQKRIAAYYTLYSVNDPKQSQNVIKSLLEDYPGLATQDFYILRGCTDREKRQLETIIKKTEYSQEDLENDAELSGYISEDAARALFTLSVEFKLDGDSLSVTLPAGDLYYDKESFILSQIIFMEFFGAGKTASNGYLFVPDGSGALINFNSDAKKSMLYTTNPVYGEDKSLYMKEGALSLSQSVRFPVYGIKENDRAMFAVIEDGEAMASIISQSGNIISSYETVFPNFLYAATNLFNYTDSSKQKGNWMYYDKNGYASDYKVRYFFLTGEDADYTGMAKTYNRYLVDLGALTKQQGGGNSPFYLELLGLLDKRSTFLGIPYTEKIPLTTFSQAEAIVKELNSMGIQNINLRYNGWFNGGLNYTVPNKVSVEGKLGGAKGLKTLNDYLTSNGFGFYPDIDFTTVRRTGFLSGYSSLFDAPKSIDRNVVTLQPFDMISSIGYIKYDYYAVSPQKSTEYYKNFFKNYQKHNIAGISIGSAGTTLLANYDEKAGVNLQQAKDIMTENLSSQSDKMGNLMVDGGNAYVLPYADHIIKIPMSNSNYVLMDESIPFMQMVLHGYINYAGGAMNLSEDINTQILKNAEYGASLYYSAANQNTNELKNSVYSYYYSINYETWKESMVENYQKLNDVLSKVSGAAMTRHEKLADGVYQTTYENGVAIIVNYNDAEAEAGGVTVPARSFVSVNR